MLSAVGTSIDCYGGLRMPPADGFDAVVVGSGPNGLVAAVRLAEAGRGCWCVEAATVAGGGLRTEELTLPGFRHDVCATVLPLALASPAFRALDLGRDGVEFAHPPVPAAHPLDDRPAALVHRLVEATAAGFGRDGRAWRATVGAAARAGGRLVDTLLAPLDLPQGPAGRGALRPARRAARDGHRRRCSGSRRPARPSPAWPPTRCWTCGRPSPPATGCCSAALAHHVGWPVVRGG